jgi:UDP-N-acetylmuramate dehydrogenase
LTTFGIGGPARFLAEVTDENEVPEGFAFAQDRKLPVFILGGGSNLLVADSGFPGLVLQIALTGIHPSTSESGCVTVGAGEPWDPFVHWCVERNWAGIECLSGIPGTVGGTPIQNVGAYGQEASEVIVSVRVFDRVTQKFAELGNAECGFTYRRSIFNSTTPDRYLVVSVTYALRPGGEPQMQYADIQRYFANSSARPTLLQMREAVRQIRASKAMLLVPGDPDCKSAGSFFKNPVVSEPKAARIEEEARRQGKLTNAGSLPRFKAPGAMVKIPAAWLIEHAGLHKGYGKGRAGLSTKHTLALVNRGGATAADVLALMHEIQDRVMTTFGVMLKPEPVFVGFE